mgnify:CR=1 FL=1|tara:strand:+ start:274 stop:1353 length:1080 start_codon:yes stop_codon:yes gene_type:complete
MKFPREVWPSANKQTNTFGSKRTLVYNQNEFNNFVKLYNGKMNCFTSVYDYEQYTAKQAVTSTVILDRVFLDFDAHHGEVNETTGAQIIGTQQIKDCLEDLDDVIHHLIYHDYKFEMSFSGRGFHVYVYGEPTTDIRRLTAFFNEIKALTSNGTLDSSAISSRRLRRIRNTMNMKASYGDGCYYCIPLDYKESSNLNADQIMELAKKPNNIPINTKGNILVKWPEVSPIEESEIEAEVINVGNLPMPPCMHSAIMIENPTDEARAYLVSWYRDLLIWADFNVDFTTTNVILDIETRQKMINQITAEIKHLHEKYDVWLDFNEEVTKYRVGFIINGGYNFPNCNKLITNGYCVGKCWRIK